MPKKKTRRAQAEQLLPRTQEIIDAQAAIANVLDSIFTAQHRLEKMVPMNPVKLIGAMNGIIDQFFSPPRPRPVDLSAISDETYERFEHVALSDHPITRRLIKKMRTRVRELWFWKPRQMAAFLNISRPHLENIIAGRKEWDAEFERRFRLLERRIAAWTYERKRQSKDVLTVASPHRLPATFEILAKPIQCAECGRWIIPASGNQKYCPDHHGKRAARAKA